MTSFFRVLALSLCALLGARTSLCLALDTERGTRILRSADVHAEDYPTVQAVNFMNQYLMKATNKKFGIQVFPSGLLGDEGPLLELVQTGELDMNRISIQALDAISPLSRVVSLPYLFRDPEHMHKVLDGPVGEEIMASLNGKGLVGLAFYDAGVRSIYTLSKPILKLEDMKGLSIRVQPSELSVMVFELLGAKPVRLPFAQTARALSNGLIDAAENNLPSYSSTEHYKYAPLFSQTRHTMSPEVLVISKRSWDQLTSEEQHLLRKAAQESVPIMRELWQQREDRVGASMKLSGVKFIEISPKEMARFSAAVQPVYAKFAADPRQQSLIRRIRATQ